MTSIQHFLSPKKLLFLVVVSACLRSCIAYYEGDPKHETMVAMSGSMKDFSSFQSLVSRLLKRNRLTIAEINVLKRCQSALVSFGGILNKSQKVLRDQGRCSSTAWTGNPENPNAKVGADLKAEFGSALSLMQSCHNVGLNTDAVKMMREDVLNVEVSIQLVRKKAAYCFA